MKTILVLCGGRSDEHEISLISAKGILNALDRKKFTPLLVGISRKGVWYLEDENSFYKGEFRADKIKLNENASPVFLAPYVGSDKKGLLQHESGKKYTFDCVFPILHGQFGEDGTLQGLLELMGIPFVGSGCGSSYICMDKVITKLLCEKNGLACTPYVWLSNPEEITSKKKVIKEMGFPLFVKPSSQGSSVGITKVTKEKELTGAIQEAFRFDSKVLIEKGIEGREIECSVLGTNLKPKASLPGEIIPSEKIGWYNYEAKYLLSDGAKIIIPADLNKKEVSEIQNFAIKIFQVMGCEGFARIDIFLEKKTGQILLNEVNTVPGFTPISMYPKMWEASGLSYQELITKLIELAGQRGK